MRNIMIDLESLDSAPTGVLVSIGAVYFDIDTQTLGPEFYNEVVIEGHADQMQRGRTLNMYTLSWWMQQSDNARDVFLCKPDQVTPEQLLINFCGFCELPDEPVRVWGNGSDFDCVFLRDMYKTYDIVCPWAYHNNRCYRTIKNMLGDRAELVRTGAHHNALDDAITQAKHLMAMLKGLHIND